MSVPVVLDTTPEPEALAQYCDGIWKSPTNTPESTPVSTNVKPVAPSPLSPLGAVEHMVPCDLFNQISSSNVTYKNIVREVPSNNDLRYLFTEPTIS
jgi:hypothetical protein